MNFVFFGTPDFAAIILEKLIAAGFVPTAVICNPDRPVGRKKIITPPPTKLLANKHGIQVLQPENPSSLFSILSSFGADFAVVAAYAKIIPKEIIDIFPRGATGVHPSLLPKYRGPTPVQSAILGGEEETGVTLYLLDEKVDHGSVLAKGKLRIADRETYGGLIEKLAVLGGELLLKTLPDYIAGKILPQAQDDGGATYTKKFTSEDAFIAPEDLRAALGGDPKKTAAIDRKIRALNPEPGVWTFAELSAGAVLPGGNKRTKLLAAETRGEKLALKKIQFGGERPRNL
jgi:methionyl-tRNA formyltransferase